MIAAPGAGTMNIDRKGKGACHYGPLYLPLTGGQRLHLNLDDNIAMQLPACSLQLATVDQMNDTRQFK